MKRLALAAVVLTFAGLAVAARAADAGKTDPTGSWKWTAMAGGQSREVTLKLKLDGDKLTGSMPARMGRETMIEDGTFKDGTVSFKVTRMMGDNKIVQKYSGKLSGDTITGKIEMERGGQTMSRDWEAKRSKD